MQIAASVLESFYNVVIDNVRQKWIQQQPVNYLTITWENSGSTFRGDPFLMRAAIWVIGHVFGSSVLFESVS